MKQVVCFLVFVFSVGTSVAIGQIYTTANAHSHNDYEQKQPFTLAYNELFGSIEADIHLKNGILYVGHDAADPLPTRTLEYLYLAPIAAYNNASRKLQLLIDIKTEAISTLDALVLLLKKYPAITNNPNIRVVISGNAPKPAAFASYPSFIWFDGRIKDNYTPAQLAKIALMSASFQDFLTKKAWPLHQQDLDSLQAGVNKAHALHKPVRFWASPDFPAAWEQLIYLNVDFINTDKITALSDYLVTRDIQLRELPYNRVIHSAGKVVRYGKPELENHKLFVTNWAGKTVTDSTSVTAGVPWGLAYTSPVTGATTSGTVSVFNALDGTAMNPINVGLHPNAILASADQKYIYVANGSSDEITVINASTNQIIDNIFVGMLGKNFQGSTPNGLALSPDGKILYVSNGLDNAIAVVHLGKNNAVAGTGKSFVEGFIPTEAYPAGLLIKDHQLIVANLESDGANVVDATKKARNIHQELASVSIIPVPDKATLKAYATRVAQQNLVSRVNQVALPARPNTAPVPVPERIGEPSVFKHVVYIIKENKTYDQVLGDVTGGNGDSSLCVFGNKYTPNTHAIVKQFGGMDNYHASGKSSAEGHQWTDAGMVSDYVEKNVRAWFRSYPHRQEDALVYNKAGFIWNHALAYGKSVRVFGEACETVYDQKLNWFDLYKHYQQGIKPNWVNTTTIDNLNPIISPTFPDCDNIAFSDQQRASIFIEEWNQYAAKDSLPNLMVVSLPNDHTAGTSPNFPTPYAMVADNDLALGRIIEMISKSKYWDSTVIFITEDDSQGGWDHVSAYRTVGMVVSAYSSNKMVHTNYNQVSMLRTIEQILGVPPMNSIDATSRVMFDCFKPQKNTALFTALPNQVPLDERNKPLAALQGTEKKHALISQREFSNEVDGGQDQLMNQILWHFAKGNVKYPKAVHETQRLIIR
jgi:YVTN family beta-propeller protein